MVNSKDEIKEGDVLNAKEVCKILKISVPTIERILSEKREPGRIFAKKVGRSWKILREDIYRYLKEADKNISKYMIRNGDVLDVKEVCKILKISGDLVRKTLSEERVPDKIFGKKVGRSWKILREDIYRYLKEADKNNKKYK